ncbi:MAG TPA: hypothetical protein VMQ76_13410 [Terracidiphilus sp.]|jgi:hypothetical protein|nr:hypothetical protein [Terracidiphilus sp.]
MKALSLWQPHAIAIGLGIKRYETRGWQLLPQQIGVPIAIHAAKKEFRERDYPWEYFTAIRTRLRSEGISLQKLDYGKVICICIFTACRRTSELRGKIGDAEFWGDFRDRGDDGKDRWAFEIGQALLIPASQRPEITGRQGFFNVPDELGLWWAKDAG